MSSSPCFSCIAPGLTRCCSAPVWKDVADPIERVFALLAKYRELIVKTDCTYGCPIGSLALELHEPDPPVRALLEANSRAWVDAIERCLVDAARAACRGDVDKTCARRRSC